MRISDWSSDVCSSDLPGCRLGHGRDPPEGRFALCFAPLSRESARPAMWFRIGKCRPAATASDGRQDQRARRFLCSRRLRSEEHTSELQSLMRISYAVFCLKKKKESQTVQY